MHDYFEHDGTPYIAMEYVERGSLRPYVGRMNLAQIGGVLEGLLAGLTHAESNGIVHRDLKPENLMVTADGRVKIADFGIAKATTKMQTGAFLTATGTTVGTPTYMAPEQAMAQDIGPWTDLYSVGCMAFELFTGNVPFHDSDAPMAILLRHVNEPIAPVKSIRPEVDQRISDWIERLLVKEPTQRTQNAQDAWDDFEEIVLGLLGPRWRREARLVERVDGATDGAKPLTPAPFQGTSAGDPGLRGVQVVRLGRARRRHRRRSGGAADVDAAAVGVDAVDPRAGRRPADADAVAGRARAAAAGARSRADRRFRVRHVRPARARAADRRARPARAAGSERGARGDRHRRRRPSPEPRARSAVEGAAEGVRDLRRAAALAAADERARADAAARRGRGARAGPARARARRRLHACARARRACAHPGRGHDDAELAADHPAEAAEGRRRPRRVRRPPEVDHPGRDRRRRRRRRRRRGDRHGAAAARTPQPRPPPAAAPPRRLRPSRSPRRAWA